MENTNKRKNFRKIIPKELFDDFKKKAGDTVELSPNNINQILSIYIGKRYTNDLLKSYPDIKKPNISQAIIRRAFGEHINNKPEYFGYSKETIELIIDYTYTNDIKKESFKDIHYLLRVHSNCQDKADLLRLRINNKILNKTRKKEKDKGNISKTKAQKVLGNIFHNFKPEDKFDREDYIAKALLLLKQHHVILIDGLKSTGKTCFAKTLHNRLINKGIYKAVFWKYLKKYDNLDVFIKDIEHKLPLDGRNNFTKALNFIHYLDINNFLLIIQYNDDDENNSFLEFIKTISSDPLKARIILIRNSNLDFHFLNSKQTICIEAYNKLEVQERLLENRINLSETQISQLINKTDGLPFFINLFIDIYRQDNNINKQTIIDELLLKPDSLNWFNQLIKDLLPDERKLLHILSLYRVPFNFNIINALGSKIGIKNIDDLFKKIKKTIYLKEVTNDSWLIPPYISDYFNSMDNIEFNELISEYIIITNNLLDKKNYTIEELQLFSLAIIHLQNAGNYRNTGYYIRKIMRSLKTAGMYSQILDLINKEINVNKTKEYWLIWDYAHICLITGNLAASLFYIYECINYSLSKKTIWKNYNDKVSFFVKSFQLYSDYLVLMKLHEEAIEIFSFAISHIKLSDFNLSLRTQTISNLSWYYIKSNNFKEAEEINQFILSDSTLISDQSIAIAKTRLGIVYLLSDEYNNSISMFSDAVAIFDKIKDVRGLAWSSMYYAKCLCLIGKKVDASPYIKDVILTNKENNLYDFDYYDWLLFISNFLNEENSDISKLLLSERNRISLKEKKIRLDIGLQLIIDKYKIILSRVNYLNHNKFNYKSYLISSNNNTVKIGSLFIDSISSNVKKNPIPVLDDLFKNELIDIFSVHQNNKKITESLKNEDYKEIILNKYIIPYIEIIKTVPDFKSSIKYHYARSLEYAGAFLYSFEILKCIPDEDKNFQYYNILANCYKRQGDFNLSFENYKYALSITNNKDNKGRALNNIASLIYKFNKYAKYRYAIEMCKEAIQIRSDEYEFIKFPIKTLILLEIELINTDSLENVVTKFKSLIKHYEVNKRDSESIVNEVKNTIKRKKLKTYFNNLYQPPI